MSTWPNRGASGGPCGGLEERKTEHTTVRPTRSDSSQQASSKPGAVHVATDFRPPPTPGNPTSNAGRRTTAAALGAAGPYTATWTLGRYKAAPGESLLVAGCACSAP